MSLHIHIHNARTKDAERPQMSAVAFAEASMRSNMSKEQAVASLERYGFPKNDPYVKSVVGVYEAKEKAKAITKNSEFKVGHTVSEKGKSAWYKVKSVSGSSVTISRTIRGKLEEKTVSASSLKFEHAN